MKVIILTMDFPRGGEDITISGGPSYYFHNICELLDKSDMKAVILCRNDRQGSEVEQKRRIIVYRIDPKRYFVKSLSLIRCLSDNNTIILTDGPAYTLLFGLLAKILRLRLVGVFHDCRTKYYLSRLLTGHLDFGALLGILLTYGSVLVNPKAIITVSETSKQELINTGFKSDKIFVTYNWVTLDYTHECPKQDLVVHIGLAPWKNLGLIIEAMPYILARVPTAQLYVIGSGDIESYRERVRNKKIADKVHFCGLTSEKTKQSILRKSKVLTLVSSFEGFGIPILEAWKNDVAPVVSRLPVFQEIAVDGKSCIMTSFDPKEIANSVLRLLQNDELRIRLCENGKKAILSRFSSENAYAKFKEAIDSLMTSVATTNR